MVPISKQVDEKALPVSAEVYKIIKSQIISLKLLPGQLLMVQQLAQELGVSRTPVREALLLLSDEELVTEADGRKFRVSEISWKIIDDIYAARILVEMEAAGQVAKNGTAGIKRLEQLVAKMEDYCKTNDFTAYLEADKLFHATLMDLHGNQVLVGWLARIQDQQQRIRYLTTGISSRIERSNKEHHAILNAILKKNEALARKTMRQHLMRAWNDVHEFKDNPFNLSKNLIRE